MYLKTQLTISFADYSSEMRKFVFYCRKSALKSINTWKKGQGLDFFESHLHLNIQLRVRSTTGTINPYIHITYTNDVKIVICENE